MILISVILFIIRNFSQKRFSAGQALIWLIPLFAAEVLTLFPGITAWVGRLFGNLLPVSWISFLGIIFLIMFLLYQTIRLNQMKTRLNDLTREVGFYEQRIRELENLMATRK